MKAIALGVFIGTALIFILDLGRIAAQLERMADNTEPTQYPYTVDIDENWMYIYSEEGFIGRVPFNQCPICDSIFIADNL